MRLKTHNMVLEEAIGSRLVEGKREACELTTSDFDNTRFKVVVNPGEEKIIKVMIDLPCWRELEKLGASEALKEEYGQVCTVESKPEPGFCVMLTVACTDDETKNAQCLEKMIYLKRNLLGAPFHKAFKALAKGTAVNIQPFSLPWRPTETIYVCVGSDPANPADHDRLIIIYAIDMPDEADRAMCRIILQQFEEVQRKVSNAPPVSFSEPNKPPLELKQNFGVSEAQHADLVGFLSITIFPRHVNTQTKIDKRVELCVGLRNYIQYHIKAAKTNQHMRMRKKVSEWLQVLNRAIQSSTAPREMKTASGRTFTRK